MERIEACQTVMEVDELEMECMLTEEERCMLFDRRMEISISSYPSMAY